MDNLQKCVHRAFLKKQCVGEASRGVRASCLRGTWENARDGDTEAGVFFRGLAAALFAHLMTSERTTALSTPTDSFQELMGRLRSGDENAAERIFQEFARRLVGLARQRLTENVKGKLDPEDIMQSVFRTFFVRHGAGEFEFTSWHDLWNLLAAITVRKCGGRIDYYRASRRDVMREANPVAAQDSAALWEPLARDPTASEAMMLVEITENLMRTLSERDRQIIELSLKGESPEQISTKLGCSERTVERVLERIRATLEKWNDPE